MQEYLNTSIKEIIGRFPEVENILDEYHIGCGPCALGSCLLKDIVEIHRLPADQEEEMTARIARVIFPDREIEIPKARRRSEARSQELTYSPPLKKLVDEHALIKRWVAIIPRVIERLDMESEGAIQTILDGVDFIRSYADRYHHAKEEDILFKYFDENLDILKVMHEDHERARGHVKAVLEALERKDTEAISHHLNAYRELLTEHIKKEDEILYPWMDNNLSVSQIGRLFSQFGEVDAELGRSPETYERFISSLEEELKSEEV